MFVSSQAYSLHVIVSLLLLAMIVSYPIYEFQQQAFMIPHPQKAHRGGQDAFFSNNELLIVSDGVGGWNSYGIDPSKFSRFLCSKGAELFNENKTFFRDNPVEIIAQAARLNDNLGSATMVVLSLKDDQLKTCYIGDSGFIILRPQYGQYSLHFEFQEQQHSFNFPFQLARKDYKSDDPYQSICQDHQIQENDIVVVGSDGLFDNVFSHEIEQMINEVHTNDSELFGLKERLAKLAIERGKDTEFWSPFADRASDHNIKIKGGKLDDTTVIISRIRRINNSEESTEGETAKANEQEM